MDTTASLLTSPTADRLDGVAPLRTPAVAARRAKQRRQMLDLVGVSYVVDGALLLVFAYAGTISPAVAAAFTGCGLTTVALFVALSESGINNRFKDHYLVVHQLVLNMLIMLGFAYAVPQVGILFICGLFVIFSFSSLRSTPQQTAISWSTMALSVATLFLLTDRPISIPHEATAERFGTMLVIISTIGSCAFLGTLSSSQRESLYKRGVQLKEAYKRIEELAELDELTGSYNRRCIMRILDDEIAYAERNRTPLAVALIDLDWFKRINDTFGHPTGDEVLRTFAISIYANLRSIDKFGRYGGEEFLLVLPGADIQVASQILERLRQIVAQLDWSAFSPGMAVTISAGISALAPGEASDALLARADRALYGAKDQGRNRINSA